MTLLSSEGAVAGHLRSAHPTGPTLGVVVASSQDDESRVSPETVVLGLPLLRRVVLTAQRAGFFTIFVVTSDPSGLEQMLDGTSAVAILPSDMSAHFPRG